jgi:hypothetical protein
VCVLVPSRWLRLVSRLLGWAGLGWAAGKRKLCDEKKRIGLNNRCLSADPK